MSKAIQRRRGTTTQHASFAGLAGEITVDTDKKTLVVHDGATLGGAALAKESHTHAIATVTNLQTTLDGKAAASHSHAIADTTGLQTALDGKAPTSHTHAIANVTNLQTTLDGKLGTAAKAADASLLNGVADATAATASTIARRDSSGNLAAVLFNGTATSARYA